MKTIVEKIDLGRGAKVIIIKDDGARRPYGWQIRQHGKLVDYCSEFESISAAREYALTEAAFGELAFGSAIMEFGKENF